MVAAATTLVVVGAVGAGAQVTLPPLLPTTTTAPPGGTPAAPPSTPPTTAADVLGKIIKAPVAPTVPPTAPPAAPKPAAPAANQLAGNAGGEGLAPPADAGPFPSDLAAMMNSVRRTRPNNSNALVDALKGLTDLGMPVEEAMRVGMGRFPVAGRANYSHDWWYPRFGPGWRLHQGTDVFGARGTPLRSPTAGTVRFGDGGLGGISVYVTQSDGTYFYFAHLNGRPAGLRQGQTVNPGDIVGYLGSTGNASGGSPHLHFEVHPAIRIVTVGKGRKQTTKAVSAPVRPGTVLPAIDPKPLLDLYLSEAMAQLPSIVETYRANGAAAAPAPTVAAVPVETAAIAGRHLAVGGLIAADAPLARTPLLLLAFLLMVMVAALMPVLAPRRGLLSAAPAGAEPPKAKARRGRKQEAPGSAEPAQAGTTGNGAGRGRRGRAGPGKGAPGSGQPPPAAGPAPPKGPTEFVPPWRQAAPNGAGGHPANGSGGANGATNGHGAAPSSAAPAVVHRTTGGRLAADDAPKGRRRLSRIRRPGADDDAAVSEPDRV